MKNVCNDWVGSVTKMILGAVFVVGLVLGWAVTGCGPNADRPRGEDGGGGESDAAVDAQGGSDVTIWPDSGPRDAEICIEHDFEIQALQPNLLIMLDRSGSMDNSVPNTTLNRCCSGSNWT